MHVRVQPVALCCHLETKGIESTQFDIRDLFGFKNINGWERLVSRSEANRGI